MLRPYEEKSQGSSYFLWEFVIVITLFCSFGFPGNMEDQLGGMFSTGAKYLPFLMQLTIMLLASGQSYEDIKLLDLQKRYIPVYCLLVLFFVVSMLVTSQPKEQFISCIRFSVTALFALWMSERYDVDKMLEFCYYALMLFVLATIAYTVLFPGTAFSNESGERSFVGLYLSKNACGTQMSFGIILQMVWYKVLSWKNKPVPRHFVVLLIAQAVFLLMANTSGALLCILVPLGYVFVMGGTKEDAVRLPLGFVHVVASVGFLLFALTIIPLFQPFFELIGKDATLTGRIPIWRQLIDVMTYHNTMTGFGYSMFWKDHVAVTLFHAGFEKSSYGNTMTFGAHNALIEFWLDVGLLGVTAYIFMMIVSFSSHRIARLSREQYALCSAVILWLTCKGILERMYFPFCYPTLFLFFCIGLALNAPAGTQGRQNV